MKLRIDSEIWFKMSDLASKGLKFKKGRILAPPPGAVIITRVKNGVEVIPSRCECLLGLTQDVHFEKGYCVKWDHNNIEWCLHGLSEVVLEELVTVRTNQLARGVTLDDLSEICKIDQVLGDCVQSYLEGKL